MGELGRIYDALIADPIIQDRVGDRIKFYEYPETGEVIDVMIIIDPLSEPIESEYGDDEPIAEKFPIQVDVWSKDADLTDLVMKQVNKVLRGIGYYYDSPGPKEYDSGIFRSVRRYTGTYYTSYFEGAH